MTPCIGQNRNNEIFWQTFLFALLLPVMSYAQAATQNSVADVLCEVGGWIWGPLGQLIGILGVICLGLAAMFGKIQLSSVLTTMAGIALIFGAQSIVQAMGLNATCKVNSPSAANIFESPIYHMFACIITWFNGPVGKALATLAIIALGIFALYGKISYHQGLVVAAGIAAIFGAVSIIGNLGVPISIKTANTVKDLGDVSDPSNFPLHFACSGGGSIENVYCSVIAWFNGPLGKALATLGMIILGLGALYGKVSWGLAMVAGLGVSLVFGGTTIVEALGGPGAQQCVTGQGATGPLSLAVLYCNVIAMFNGAIGKGVAVIAVIIFGIGALMGKVSWQIAIVLGVGVALVFGGTTIVSALGGDGARVCP